MEVARHLVDLNRTRQLAALFLCQTLDCVLDHLLGRVLVIVRAVCVNRLQNLALLVQNALLHFATNIRNMHSSDVDEIECQDGAWRLRESDIQIEH